MLNSELDFVSVYLCMINDHRAVANMWKFDRNFLIFSDTFVVTFVYYLHRLVVGFIRAGIHLPSKQAMAFKNDYMHCCSTLRHCRGQEAC